MIGIDIVDISRISQAKFFDRVSEYILRDEEILLMHSSRDKFQYLASRLAAKEAVVKAFPAEINLQDIAVTGIGSKPIATVYHPDAKKYYIHISISHTEMLAMGAAIITQT